MSKTLDPGGPGRVLVVEDDPHICDVLEYALQADGYQFRKTNRGREAVLLCETEPPDVIVLDVGLPDLDGFEVCRLIRQTSNVPIIFLTSRGDEINRVVGLEIGGDDYLVKPFSTRELLARIKVIRRRGRAELAPAATDDSVWVKHGEIQVNHNRFRVLYHQEEVILTRQEFRLLELFVKNPGRVFTRDELLDRAWEDGGCVTDRTIDVHIKGLRKKLAAVRDEDEPIETVRGIGYRMRE